MARPKKEGGVDLKRIQVDLPPRSLDRLKRLQSLTEAASYAEVVKNALRLYEAVVEEVENGNDLLIKRGDSISPYPVFAG